MSTAAYRVGFGCAVAGAWAAVLVGGISYFAAGGTDGAGFLHWGPSEVRFGGMTVDTWPRWAAVMAYSVCSQAAYGTVSATLSPYVSNVLRDHKTPPSAKGPYVRAQAIMQLYTLFHWLASVFDVFLWITLQLQYILPAVLVDLVLTGYFTHGYLVPRGAQVGPLLQQISSEGG